MGAACVFSFFFTVDCYLINNEERSQKHNRHKSDMPVRVLTPQTPSRKQTHPTATACPTAARLCTAVRIFITANQFVRLLKHYKCICVYIHVHSHYTTIYVIKNNWNGKKKKSFGVIGNNFHFQLDNPCTSELHCEEILCVCYLFLCGTILLP